MPNYLLFMQTSTESITYKEITIELIRKKIKNLHLRIYAPDAKTVISAPLHLSISKIENFIDQRISWIKKTQEKLRGQKIIPKKKFLSGENHLFFGKNFLLEVKEDSVKNLVVLRENTIELNLKKRSNIKERQKILDNFYRSELKKIIPSYIKKWEEKMHLKVATFGIKKMKTRWGTCNIKARRIWINLELAKYQIECLEYIIVHEMVHLFERNHNKKFFAHMDHYLPNWKNFKEMLKK